MALQPSPVGSPQQHDDDRMSSDRYSSSNSASASTGTASASAKRGSRAAAQSAEDEEHEDDDEDEDEEVASGASSLQAPGIRKRLLKG